MARAIICKGDPTSHGGQVLEGSANATIDGRPIALRGHLTYCPLCKGKFPISEGLDFHTFGGLGTAVEGMKTGCGAILIATQHQMTVDDQPGASTTARSKAERSAKHTAIATPVKPPAAANIAMVYVPHKRLNAQQREDYDKYLMRASTLQVLASFKNKAARRKRAQSKSASIKHQWDAAKIRLVKASVHAGVNPETVVKIAAFESRFNPDARPIAHDKSRNTVRQFDGVMAVSTAHGYGQFTDAGWMDALNRYGEKYEINSAGTLSNRNAAKYRTNEDLQAAMLAELTKANIAKGRVLGGVDDNANVYALHNLGSGDGQRFLRALAKDHNTSVADVLSKEVIKGNPSLYGNGSLTLQDAYERMSAAMAGGQQYADEARNLSQAK